MKDNRLIAIVGDLPSKNGAFISLMNSQKMCGE